MKRARVREAVARAERVRRRERGRRARRVVGRVGGIVVIRAFAKVGESKGRW